MAGSWPWPGRGPGLCHGPAGLLFGCCQHRRRHGHADQVSALTAPRGRVHHPTRVTRYGRRLVGRLPERGGRRAGNPAPTKGLVRPDDSTQRDPHVSRETVPILSRRMGQITFCPRPWDILYTRAVLRSAAVSVLGLIHSGYWRRARQSLACSVGGRSIRGHSAPGSLKVASDALHHELAHGHVCLCSGRLQFAPPLGR